MSYQQAVRAWGSSIQGYDDLPLLLIRQLNAALAE
jgi:hypothetical protein